MIRITIPITETERDALRQLAKIELRDARQQAALILRNELERRGLLEPPIREADKSIKQEANRE
jgi:hypothetical protein